MKMTKMTALLLAAALVLVVLLPDLSLIHISEPTRH